jgi:opacity protein-like surface antigen
MMTALAMPVQAADMPTVALPAKAAYRAPAPCTLTACSGFYVGGGLIGAGSNMDVLGSGIANSVFAGGGAIALDAGYQFWNGSYFFGLEGFGGYEIANNSSLIPGAGNQNRYIFGELVKVGIGLNGLLGGVPTAPATPSQSPVPINIPDSIKNSLLSPYFTVGALERPWGTAWATGAGAEFVLAANWSLDLKYLHAVYGNNATVAPGQVQKTDNLLMLMAHYKF